MSHPYHDDVLDQSPAEAAPDRAASDVPAPQQTQKMGELLDEPDLKKVARKVVSLLREQVPARKRRRAEWKCNELWLQGVRGARVRRLSEDRNDVELFVPAGAFDLPPIMDRTDELVDKVVSHLLADPPVPEAEPATDSDADRDAAEFTTRLLTVESSESGFNNLALMRKAERKAAVRGSAFLFGTVDPKGGGWRPMEIQAHPQAQTTDDALLMPEQVDELGQPLPREDAPEDALVKRYVKADRTLTDTPDEAEPQWLPKIKAEVLTGEQVVLLPETCSGISDATGILVIRYTPLNQLRAEFPAVAKLEGDDLRALVEFNPEDAKHAMPGRPGEKRIEGTTDDGKVKDNALVCTLSLYYTSHGAYQKGAYLVVGGSAEGPIVLHRQPWAGVVETGEGEVREECLMLPCAQVRQLDDDLFDDPYGRGLVARIGPADEVRGQITLAWLEYLDRFLHPNMLYPVGSIVDPGDWEARDGRPIFFNPQGQPQQEEVPEFPRDGKEFFDRATEAQNSATMLEEAAQGVDTATATSGIAKQIVVQQAHVNLSTMRHNAADGQERWWRVVAQLMRCFFTVPMRVKYLGDDGAYKEREWTRADLGSTKDIRIARGSFTQQAPEQKQAQLDARYQMQLIEPDEYERLSASNLRAAIGFQDNPHRMRVRKQLSQWRAGPPQGWAEQQAMTQQQMALIPPEVDPMTGQPLPPPPDPANPFADVRPVDDEPDVAQLRWREIRREMAGGQYAKFVAEVPQWAQYLVDAYMAARQAAGVQSLAEQAAAQAEAAAMQAEQQQDAAASETAAKEAERGSQQQFTRELQDDKHRQALERDAMRAQGAPMVNA